MKIGLIQNLKSNYLLNINRNRTSNPIAKSNISFHSEQDIFETSNNKEEKSIDYEEVEKTLSILNKRLEKIIKESDEIKNKHFESSREKLFATRNCNKKLEELREDYKKIKEILNTNNTNEINKTVEIVADFLQRMEQIGQDRGFNRIVGYDDTKKFLKDKFIFDSILKDKISENTNIPNALLFYGPTGNGKTTFAIALAEQALMTPYIVNAANIGEVEAMNMIENYANQSKKRYESSKNKQHSIIVVDEADSLTQQGSPVVERFKNLIKNCAKEYNCTFFLTTNYPLDLPQEILSNNITPFKVPVAPPDDFTVKTIIDKKLKQANCVPQDGTLKIVEELFKDPAKKYSNGDINKLIERILFLNPNPTTQDIINAIKEETVPPTLTVKKMKKFQDEIKRLN